MQVRNFKIEFQIPTSTQNLILSVWQQRSEGRQVG